MTRQPSITDLVPLIIWTNDVQGNANYFNQRWYEYSGLSYDESEGPGWQAIAHKDDMQAVEEWASAFKEKRLFEAEARLRNKDGNYEWHLLKNVPFTDTSKKFQGWFGSATNIQRLKNEEIAFRRTSSYLKAVLDTAVDFAIINLDGQGMIIGWNRGASIMFGYEEQEILGKPSNILFTTEDRVGGIPHKELAITRDAGRYLDERWHMRKDGTKFFMSGVVTPMKDYEGFVKIARDTTDKKLAEEALLLTEHRSDLAVESNHIGEWSWDLPGDLINVDAKAQYLLGLTTLSFSGHDFWQFIYADDVEKVRQEFNQALSGINVFQSELRVPLRGAEGGYRWINCYGRIIAHESGAPTRMVGVIYDISQRKALEKQKDDFISLASHELKTPVTTIKGYTELLYDIFEQSHQEENVELIVKLNSQVDRLIRLLHLLLDSTIMTQAALVLTPEQFDVNELLVDQVEDLKKMSNKHTLILKREKVSMINADRERIGQVITNFITNAIKYSPHGGDIIVSSEDALDGVIVKVQDFGIGMSEEERAKMFTQFYRASNKNVRSLSGFGLGLYISAQIIKQHHGLIGVESTPGEGSTFYFKIFYS